MIGQIQAGKLRPLAVTSPARTPRLPDVPTLAEAGVKGVDIVQWYAVLALRQLPAPILAQLDQALAQTLKDPDARGEARRPGHGCGRRSGNTRRIPYLRWNRSGARYGKLTTSLGLDQGTGQAMNPTRTGAAS